MPDPDPLGDLLAQWEEERAAGRDVPVDELCRDHPHLADRVAEEIRLLRRVDWLDRSFQETTGGRWSAPAEVAGAELTGRYRLERPLGRGGFGVVWLATEVRTRRPVALKLPHLRPQSRTQPQTGWKEFALVERLQHPNIVPVYDAGVHNEKVYTVTQFVNGGTLAEAVRRGPIDPADGLRIVRDVAGALLFLHGQGVIHRDVKPANVLIDLTGRALLTDFGLAVQAAPGAAVVPRTTGGTPAYEAPEQLRVNAPVDHRCDQYALGVVLFEVLTGRGPFAGRAVSELGARLIHREPPADLPADVELAEHLNPVIRRCLAESPTDRYPSMAELIEELNGVLARLEAARTVAPPDPPRRRRAGYDQRTPWRSALTLPPLRWPTRRRLAPKPPPIRDADPGGRSWRGFLLRATGAAATAVVLLTAAFGLAGLRDPRLRVLVVVAACLGVGLVAVGRWRLAWPAVLVLAVGVGVWVSGGPYALWEGVQRALPAAPSDGGKPRGASHTWSAGAGTGGRIREVPFTPASPPSPGFLNPGRYTFL